MIRLALSASLLATAASAETPCMPRDTLLRQLADKYSEAPVSRALDSKGQMVEVVANPATGTWSQLSTRPGGKTCLVATGQGWTAVEYVIGAPL